MGKVTAYRNRKTYLDTNVFIYALEGYPAIRGALTELFIAIEEGTWPCVTSELTLAELLVKPFREADREGELRCRRVVCARVGLSVVPIGRDILVEAARLRARTHIGLADAIHLATARATGCELLLANDERLRRAAGIETLLLSEITVT